MCIPLNGPYFGLVATHHYRMAPSPFGDYPSPAYGKVVIQEDLLNGKSVCLMDYIRSDPNLEPVYLLFAKKKAVFLNDAPGMTWDVSYAFCL